ncbi:MAG: HAD hydrolase-like protein, partial [Alphaproteobacteria bacterium]
MTTPKLYDQRLIAAVHAIASGNIKLLSLDVFDTLLIRRVPRPPDAFLQLGRKLREKNLLEPTQTPDSFAAVRYQTEYVARDIQQRAHGNREVTLGEIYDIFPKHIVRMSPGELIAAEITTEIKLCFSNPDIIQIAHFAKQHHIRLALISNSYFSEKTLRKFIKTKAPDFPVFDNFFVSSEYRRGKRDGLMQLMLNKLSIKPSECLHIGDDPISDRDTAKKLGIPCIYIGHNEEDFSLRLTEEHPIQWHERTSHFGDDNGDYGLTWLRRQAGFWPTHSFNAQDEAFYRYGSCMLGPLLIGFAGWVHTRITAEKAKILYGV